MEDGFVSARAEVGQRSFQGHIKDASIHTRASLCKVLLIFSKRAGRVEGDRSNEALLQED